MRVIAVSKWELIVLSFGGSREKLVSNLERIVSLSITCY